MSARRWFADRRTRVWVEASRPGHLHEVNEHTGRRKAALWPLALVEYCYGPLMDVTPEWGAVDARVA